MNVILLAIFLVLTQTDGAEPSSLVTASMSQQFASMEACKNAGRALSVLAQGAHFNVLTTCVPHDVAKVEVVPKQKALPKENNAANPPRALHPDVDVSRGEREMKMRGVGGLVPDNATADMSCLCIWQNALLKEPRAQDFYIVELDTPAIGRHVALRWFTPTKKAGDRWRDLIPGEYVTHWLQGLREPNELLRVALLERQGRAR